MHSVKPWRIAMAGMVALAVAMGIGRFAFTPLLPMMLADGTVSLTGASWLASANYLGYLVGALLCTAQPWIARRLGLHTAPRATLLVRSGLVATVLLTLGMAMPAPEFWAVLRFAAGVASAVVFVFTSGWCLGQLARLHVPTMGALIYIGPGAGIVISGLAASAMVSLHWSAATGWLIFGVLAMALTASIWATFRESGQALSPVSAAASKQSAPTSGIDLEMALLTGAYSLAGFGYIITATFLPVIARQALPGSAWLDLFWPLFGAGVILGAITASRIGGVRDLRWLLLGCYLVQALGVATSLVSPTLTGFALGSLLLGLPFTAITFFAMQELRRLRPAQASSYMGLATALYGMGQIVGPPLAAALVARSARAVDGFNLSLQIAAAALVFGALLYALLIRWHPVPR
jgi:predicted MFS family arabinose efflux permease